jgi:acetolactate synthase-1/2/3 large subunit
LFKKMAPEGNDMNGAESLVRTLADSGIEICFGNPGTSEMHVVAALDREPRMRGVLCLFEGVAAGAADGYARMTGKPAATLLHLGPGFANAISFLHNARKGGQGIVNIVGDHARNHSQYAQAPLTSDIMGICAGVSDWLHCCEAPDAVAGDGLRCVAAAMAGKIATLILPADCAWDDARPAPVAVIMRHPRARPDPQNIERIAAALKTGKKSLLLLRGPCLQPAGLDAAGRIAQATGARLAHDYFTPRIRRGAGLPAIERIPYFAEEIVDRLAGLEQIVLVGAPPPVTFFAYPGKPSWVTPPGCELLTLAPPDEDATAALAALAGALDARTAGPIVSLVRPDAPPPGPLTSDAMGAIMTRLLPDDVILSDDSLTAGPGLQKYLTYGPAHDALFLTGGAIGDAMPMAVGAALAAPERKVIAVSGDGAAMYALPALWTMAREKLDVVTIVCANRSYNILNIELSRVGARHPGPKTLAMLDLHNPELDFVKLAEGMGVAASRATTTEEFAAQFGAAMATKGPYLIEAVLRV